MSYTVNAQYGGVFYVAPHRCQQLDKSSRTFTDLLCSMYSVLLVPGAPIKYTQNLEYIGSKT